MIITAAISTIIDGGFVDLLNMHGDLYDITAEGGHLFLALTWISVALCLLRNLPLLAMMRICLVTSERKVVQEDYEGIRLLNC
jgi:hypothetical protein